MGWPHPQDYNEAVQSPATAFSDPELRTGEAATNPLGLPRARSGTFADVYEVNCPATGARWAVKCFTREVQGLRERYAAISQHLQQAKLPFTVDFQYLDQGVRVRGQWFPVLKMRWVEGLTLNDFVRDNLEKPALLDALSVIWVRMGRRLREAKMAHADLQHGNVLLVPGSRAELLAVKLVDYDGMWVPALAATKSGEVGHPAYQHPQRLREGLYKPEVDRFPLLVVATALRCLRVAGRALWERYDNGDNLLFRESDLAAPRESVLFAELLRLEDPLARSLVTQLVTAAERPLEQSPLLEELLPEKPAASAAVRTATPSNAPRAAGATFAFAEGTDSPVRRKRGRTRETKSKAPLIIGGVALALLAIGGATFWAMRSPGGKTPQSGPGVAEIGPGKGKKPGVDDAGHQGGGAPTTKKADGGKHQPGPGEGEGTQPTAVQELAFLPPGPPGEVARLNGGRAPLRRIALTPDGKRAVTASYDGLVRLWDLEKSVPTHQMKAGMTPRVHAVAYCSKKQALSGGEDGRVRLWGLDDGSIAGTWPGHKGEIYHIAASPDGRHALSCGPDRTAILWDVRKGKPLYRLDVGVRGAPTGAFSPDGKRALTLGGDGVARLWDTTTGNERSHFEKGRGGEGCAFSPDGRQALVAADRAVLLWDIDKSKVVHRLEGHASGVYGVTFTPDGRRAVSCAGDRTVRVWDLTTGKEQCRFVGHQNLVGDVVCLPDGRHVLSASFDGTARLWRLPAADVLGSKTDEVGEVARFEGHDGEVRHVAVSLDGRLALSAAYDRSARVWDLAAGREVQKFDGHSQARVQCAAFLPDGLRALTGGDETEPSLWSLKDGKELKRFQGSEKGVNQLAITPDGMSCLSSEQGSAVRLWDVRLGKSVRTFEGHEGQAQCVAISPDGRRALTGSQKGIIRLWHIASGEELRKFIGHGPKAVIMSVAFSPDGRFALSCGAGEDHTVRLWDVATGKQVQNFVGHDSGVFGVAFSPDGRRALTCGWDKTVRLWAVASGKELKLFTGHDQHVWDVAFTPDGNYALSGSADKTLRLWRLPPETLLVGEPLKLEPRAQASPGTTPEKPDKPDTTIVRAPAPPAADVAEAQKEVRETYRADYSLRKPEEMMGLASKLLRLGQRKAEKPAMRFALLREASSVAARAADSALSLEAIDELARTFEVQALPLKTEALNVAERAARSPAAHKAIGYSALAAVDEAVAEDAYPAAAALLRTATSAAPKSGLPTLELLAARRSTAIGRLQTAYDKVKASANVLAERPTDAEASLAMGKFGCFEKEDWDRGLARLAGGSDEALAELARKDLSKPTELAKQLEVAQGWWELADKETGQAKTALLRRAKVWYRQALPRLSGLEKGKVEDRLKLFVGAKPFKPGLVTELFADNELGKKVKARIDYTVDYNWGTGSPDEDVPADNFSVRWRGYLVALQYGVYTLTFQVDDGGRLYLDDVLRIDAWGKTGRHSVTVVLDDKPHRLQLELHEGVGFALASFRWAVEGGHAEQPVPLAALYHDVGQEAFLSK